MARTGAAWTFREFVSIIKALRAVAFCAAGGYSNVILQTVSTLKAAAHLDRSAGFRKVEEKYELSLLTNDGS